MGANSPSLAARTQRRAFELAAATITACRHLPRSPETSVIRWQLVRSVTSVAANYRAACRAQSAKTFVAKISIVIEEADEVLLWLNLLVRVTLAKRETIRPLAIEADELVRILVASRKTMQGRLRKASENNRQSSIVNRQGTAS